MDKDKFLGLTDEELGTQQQPYYYEAMGQAHSDVMRCKDCRELVPFLTISKLGMCSKCGNKRFSEVVLLTQEEMDLLQNGTIDFPNKDKFLAEFSGVA